eukprot:1192383-Prorocentrum_minimum.AAC.1
MCTENQGATFAVSVIALHAGFGSSGLTARGGEQARLMSGAEGGFTATEGGFTATEGGFTATGSRRG